MRKLLIGLLLCLVFTLPAWSQEYPKAELFVGYSLLNSDLFAHRDTAHGWHASITGNPHKNFGIEADVSGHYGSVLGGNYSNYYVMVGPRVAGRFEKVTPWGHSLFGVDHVRFSGTEVSSLAWIIGGGVDYNAHNKWAVRVVQLDYSIVNLDHIILGNRNAKNFRVSFGVVYKWGGK